MRVQNSLFFVPAAWLIAAAAALGSLLAMPGIAQAQSSAVSVPPAQQTVRVRGTLVSVDAQKLVVKDRTGKTIELARAEKMSILEVYPIELADIKEGSFVGTTGMPQPDGTQKAVEVHVFPESMRGAGEGHYPWDLQPGATMTNASVADLTPAPASVQGGRTLKLRYGGGEQTVVVPPGVPIATFRAGDEQLLVAGAHVMVIAQEIDGKPTAVSVSAGRNGYVPPM